MANVFIEENILQGWADTVREKTGTTDKMLPSALLQQTQDNWGTGGGSGGGEWGLSEGIAHSDPYGTGNLIFAKRGTFTLTLDVPSDAVVYFSGCFKASAWDANFDTLKDEYFETVFVSKKPDEIESTDLGYGRKKVTLCSIDFSYNGSVSGVGGLKIMREYTVTYVMPNVKVENNVLYANSACKGLFATVAAAPSIVHPFYMEAVDLRGSNIQKIDSYSFSCRPETKKIWLPETLASIGRAPFNYDYFTGTPPLEELHFTNATPADVASNSITGLPTSCKIYVPAGSLSAYTSAQYYPDPTKYTYIEE